MDFSDAESESQVVQQCPQPHGRNGWSQDSSVLTSRVDLFPSLAAAATYSWNDGLEQGALKIF